MDSFPGTSVTALARELSDHSPIVLKSAGEDFGPKPFRFFNSWLLRVGFHDMVLEAWKKLNGHGCVDAFLAAKLWLLKKKIKRWWEIGFALETKEMEECMHMISKIDIEVESRALLPHELGNRSNCVRKIIDFEKAAAMDVRQRAKVKWIVDGDENTSFFHGYVNNQNKRNKIHGLVNNGQWVTSPEVIRSEILQYFSRKFEEKWKSRPKIISNRFKKLSPMDSSSLELPFSVEEIRNAIWCCGTEKAPGPDGFSFKFFKTYWNMLNYDIMRFVRSFEQ